MNSKKLSFLSLSIGATMLGSMMYTPSVYAQVCTAGAGQVVVSQLSSSASKYAFNCPEGKGVAEFTGGASTYINKFGTEIEAAGKEIAEQIAAASSSEIQVITNGNAELVKTMSNIANTTIKDDLSREKTMLDMKMNYMTELQERELKAEQSVVSMDDTREEVLFILSELKDVGNGDETAGYNHAHEVIAAMKAKYDADPEFMMPVRIKSADAKFASGAGCPDYDADLHKAGKLPSECYYAVKSSPGAKLEKYFAECSRVKRDAVSIAQTTATTRMSKQRQQSSQASYATAAQTQGSSVMLQAKAEEQLITNCTPSEFGYELCGTKDDGTQMTSTEYLEKVIDNTIVPYGNVSPTNYLAPVAIGSIDGDLGDISDEEFKSMQITAQQQKEANGELIAPDQAVSSNTPPLDKTYRTSAQYFAAEDFINNIVNKEAVSDIRIDDSQSADKALFKSRYMARTASLSLAEHSLRKPIEARAGSELSIALQEGRVTRDKYIDNDGVEREVLKEDLNGAAEIDRLAFAINKDYQRMSGDALKGVETAPTSSLSEYQIEALVRMNQLLLRENASNERIELLLATMVSNMANSPENVQYINSLKYQ